MSPQASSAAKASDSAQTCPQTCLRAPYTDKLYCHAVDFHASAKPGVPVTTSEKISGAETACRIRAAAS